MSADLSELVTESINLHTVDLDRLSTLEMLQRINDEDHRVARAVRAVLPQVAAAIDRIAACATAGGRLLYFGAGTSGRLAVLDAAECPPTFNVPPELVVGVIAGGKSAMFQSSEGAEDDPLLGEADVAAYEVTSRDAVIGVTASGRTPYVAGVLREARRRGAWTCLVACNADSSLAPEADLAILPVVGSEVVAGSTRLKAGTAQKLVLNMLSTGTMVKLGKVYGNLMVDVRPTNEKLRERAKRIIATAAGVNREQAASALAASGGEVKTAIVMLKAGLPPDEARAMLSAHSGRLRDALAAAGQA